MHQQLLLLFPALVKLGLDLLALPLHPLLSIVTLHLFILSAPYLLLQLLAFSRHHSLFVPDFILFLLYLPDLRLQAAYQRLFVPDLIAHLIILTARRIENVAHTVCKPVAVQG